MIYLGADHAGFALKEEIKKYLEELGYEYEDLGAKELNPQDDYSDFGLAVAEKIKEEDKGILFCGTGLGMCISANKIKGARAVTVWDEDTASQSRQHLDANVLCLGGNAIDKEKAKRLVKIWLETEFSGEERHKRRIEKIAKF